MTLVTDRLIVRPFTFDDCDFIINLLNQESFIRYIADKNVRNTDDAKQYLLAGPMASYDKFGFGLSMVMLKSTDTPIGMCGLLKRDELNHPDLGYAFLPKYCGAGYALESAKAVLAAGVEKYNLSTVLAVTLPDNARSNHLLQQAGFNQNSTIPLYGSDNNLYVFEK